jgi:hypothetical protein
MLPSRPIEPTARSPRRRSKRLPPIAVETSGTPTALAGIASLLLHLHRKQLAQQRSTEVHDHA